MITKKKISIYVFSILIIYLLSLSVFAATTKIPRFSEKPQIVGFSTPLPKSSLTRTFITASEFYEGRERSYDTGVRGGKWEITTPLKGQALNDYFKSLNLQEDPVYVLMQFETWPEGDPTQEQIDKMKQAGLIKLYQYHGDHTYPAKVTKDFLENHNFDHVRWIGLPDPEIKVDNLVLDDILRKPNVMLFVFLYDFLGKQKVNKIKLLSNNIIYERGQSLAVNISSGNVMDLLSLNFVKTIEPYSLPRKDLDRSVEVIAADYLWSNVSLANASGITVGIIDDGIDFNHTHFENITIYNATDYGGNDSIPAAFNVSHGTRIAGIISGQSNYGNRFLKGVSHQASLVIQRVYNDSDDWVAPTVNLPDIWQNILDPDSDGNYTEPSSADIISLSWSDGDPILDGFYNSYSEQEDNTTLGNNGKKVLIVTSAGNDGYSSKSKVNPPGTAKNSITVGASGDYFNSSTNENLDLKGWNSSFNNIYAMEYSSKKTKDGRVKPDILAPGSDITAPEINNNYDFDGGTSFSTPHVAGVAAQILKLNESYSPHLLKAFLLGQTVGGSVTSTSTGSGIDFDVVWGRLDAYRSVFKLSDEYLDAFANGTVGEPGSGFSVVDSYSFSVPINAQQLVVTLVWPDIAGSNNFTHDLYNDIDLYLTDNNSNVVSYSKEDDDKNNVEKYVIENPGPGTWIASVQVIDLNGTGSSQEYGLKVNAIRRTRTPDMTIFSTLLNSSIYIGQVAQGYATVGYEGLMGYDTNAWINGTSGISFVNGFDGSSNDSDRIGDIPADWDRNTRIFEIQGESQGFKTVTFNANGTVLNGSFFTVSTAQTQALEVKLLESNGAFCGQDEHCGSGFCDVDGVGWSDDSWCFTPVSGLYDGQDSKCEFSANGSISVWCDEKRNEDLSVCNKYGQTYFEDTCSDSCSINDQSVCRSNSFDATCTASSECNGVTVGLRNCDVSCVYSTFDVDKFFLRNEFGSTVAWFGDAGNVWINGSLTQNSTYTATVNDEFRFQNPSGDDVMIIDLSNGNLYLDGFLFENQGSLNPSSSSDDLIVQNSTGHTVAYINQSGSMFLKGYLNEKNP